MIIFLTYQSWHLYDIYIFLILLIKMLNFDNLIYDIDHNIIDLFIMITIIFHTHSWALIDIFARKNFFQEISNILTLDPEYIEKLCF